MEWWSPRSRAPRRVVLFRRCSGNIVLDELDQEMARRGYRFVRYADDINIYVRSHRSGQRVMASITRFIERRLRLWVNAGKSTVARPEERHFLGLGLRREPMDGSTEVLLSARSLNRIKETIKVKTPRTSTPRYSTQMPSTGVTASAPSRHSREDRG